MCLLFLTLKSSLTFSACTYIYIHIYIYIRIYTTNISLHKTNASKTDSDYTQTKVDETCGKTSQLHFVNISIFGLIFSRLPPSVVGSVSTLAAVKANFACSFHFILTTTGMDAKVTNCGRWRA
jgi:hypothetical protein